MTSAVYSAASGLSPSVRKTLTNTFFTVAAMMGLSALAAFFMRGVVLGGWPLLALALTSFGVMFLVRANRNNGMGLVWLAVFSGLWGVLLGSALTGYLALPNGTAIVAQAAGITAAAVLACAGYAMVSKRSFARIGAFLFAGLITVLVASLIGLFVQSPIFHLVVSSVAALLFVGFLLYDISSVVTGEETNYISAALSIYLDVLNLFMHLLRIFGILGED